tara:strand:+ start:66 stop:1046 length:981 start_codon:yes stop_codon:yes gene_type:complete
MSSAIDPTKPESGSATTSSVRDNFTASKTEILELQRMSEDVVATTNSGDVNAQSANFTNQDVVLAEGVRITVEIGATTSNTTPTLNVDGTGAKTIVRQDGSALVAGDLIAGQYCDLIYDSTATKWVWLNSKTDANNASPVFTGTPTSTTAAVGTNTTQIATTAFVQANNGLGVVGQWRLNADVSVGGTSLEPIGGTAGTFEEADDPTYTRVGSAMGYSSGIFTFPETGIYLIIFQSQHEAGANETNFFNKIMVTTGSGYSSISQSHTGALSGYRASATCFGVFDVTNTSTHKVRFDITGVGDAGTTLEGDTSATITGATFIKLANT